MSGQTIKAPIHNICYSQNLKYLDCVCRLGNDALKKKVRFDDDDDDDDDDAKDDVKVLGC